MRRKIALIAILTTLAVASSLGFARVLGLWGPPVGYGCPTHAGICN